LRRVFTPQGFVFLAPFGVAVGEGLQGARRKVGLV
jgi:hypothetical protein